MTDGTEAAVAAAEAAEASAEAAEAAAIAETQQTAPPVAETAEVIVAAAGAAVALADTQAAKANLDAALTVQDVISKVEQWQMETSGKISSLEARQAMTEQTLPEIASGIASIQAQLTQPAPEVTAEVEPETGAVTVTVQEEGEGSPEAKTEAPRHRFL